MDVAPLSLGIELSGGAMSVVIPRNTPIPTKMTRHTYATVVDLQTIVGIYVFEGEMPIAKDNNFLGKFFLGKFSHHNIPPAPNGGAKVDVDFNIDANGILTVCAELVGSNNRNQMTITNHSARLSKTEIDRMVKEAEDYKAQDEKRKKTAVAKNALESYIYHMRENMVGMKDKMIALRDAIEKTCKWLDWNNVLDDARKLEEKRKELEVICESVKTSVKPEIIEEEEKEIKVIFEADKTCVKFEIT
ncbi:unnamed protein product [Cuscuta campestris]|uniref:Uncharacterized protein n=1 Tax=Cuscuta campestris TaxID=132261 RepID=A0A484MKK4_9ASTE|nr:unnamed protein product [Cuscuta campestris]